MIRKWSRKEIEYKEDIRLNWIYVSENNIKFYKSQYEISIHQRKYMYECYFKGELVVTNILSLEAAKIICNVFINDYVLHCDRIELQPKKTK